jgi:hypothetical protein
VTDNNDAWRKLEIETLSLSSSLNVTDQFHLAHINKTSFTNSLAADIIMMWAQTA